MKHQRCPWGYPLPRGGRSSDTRNRWGSSGSRASSRRILDAVDGSSWGYPSDIVHGEDRPLRRDHDRHPSGDVGLPRDHCG